MQLVGKDSIDELEPNDASKVTYHPIPIEEEWRVGIVRELVETCFSNSNIDGFTIEELDEIMHVVCTT